MQILLRGFRGQLFILFYRPISSFNTIIILQVSPTDYHHFIYKCHECMLGFKRRGMLVNHLAKRHPEIHPDSVPELNMPIVKDNKDYYCQYCDKVYKSSSKRKAHILKNHPGLELPLPARIVAKNGKDNNEGRNSGGGDLAESDMELCNTDATDSPAVRPAPSPNGSKVANSTFSATVGNVTSLPHHCPFCHKQYASNAKLLQHQRKVHLQLMDKERQVARVAAPGGTIGGGRKNNGGRGGGRSQAAAGPQQPIVVEQQHETSGDATNRFALSPDEDAAAAATHLLHIQGSMSPVTAATEVVQLTPVPQEEALRLASHGATVIHVPAAQRPVRVIHKQATYTLKHIHISTGPEEEGFHKCWS